MTRGRAVRLTPTRRGWGVLGLAVACGAAWWILRLREVAMLATFLAVPVVLAGLLMGLVLAVGRPRATLTTSLPTVEVGDRIRVLARIHAPALVRTGTRLTWVVGQPGQTGTMTEYVSTPVVGEWASLGVRARRRGRLRVLLAGVESIDPLGLVSLRLRSGSAVEVLVLPALLPQGSLPEVLDAVGVHGSRGGAGEPGGSLRDYRRGDAPRTIHWKQSARQGHLLVNLPEAGGGTSHHVALVTDSEAYPRGARRTGEGAANPDFERAVSVVATLVARWCAQGAEVTMVLGGADGTAVSGTEAGPHLRALAGVSPGRRPGRDSWRGPGRAGGGVVVTGWVTPAVRREMGGSGTGVVVLTGGPGAEEASTLPSGWGVVHMSGGDTGIAGGPGAPGSQEGGVPVGHRRAGRPGGENGV